MRQRRLARAFRWVLQILSLLLLVAPAISSEVTFSIPEPEYSSPSFSDVPSRLAAAPDGRIWVTIPSRGTVGVFNSTAAATDEYLVPEGMKPGKPLPLQDKVLFLLANRDMLGVLVQGSTQPSILKLPGRPYDIAPSPSGFWVALPESENVLLLRADNFTLLSTVKVAVAYGEDVICQTEERLWAITSDYRSVAVVNTRNMETSFVALPERAYGLAPSSDESVWLVSSEEKIMHLSASGEVHTYSLPQGASPFSHLVPDGHGGVWYCDSARGRLGYRDRKGVGERPLPGARPTSPSASPDGYIWFIDEVGRRLGRVRMSVSSPDGESSRTTTTTEASTKSSQKAAEGSNTLLVVQIALAMVLLIAVLVALLRRKSSRRRKGKHR